jgi:hypothetical protein
MGGQQEPTLAGWLRRGQTISIFEIETSACEGLVARLLSERAMLRQLSSARPRSWSRSWTTSAWRRREASPTVGSQGGEREEVLRGNDAWMLLT